MVIVVDTSAVMAILQGEVEAERFAVVIATSSRRLMSAVSFQEIGMVVVGRYGSAGLARLDVFLESAGIEIVAFDRDQAVVARQAFERFGRRPARLNFGDCASYALSRISEAPLLFKGDDFSHTDLARADGPANA